ncbi:MAG: cytochrome c [Rhodospirillaceae bacterium]
MNHRSHGTRSRPIAIRCLIALTLCGLSPTTFAQSGDIAAGKKTTEFVCRNCHDVSGNEKPRNPPGGAPSFFEVAQKAETTEKSLHRFLTLPHGRMNIVQISGREVDNVVAYIMSLKRK